MKEVIPTAAVLMFEKDKTLLVRHGESASHLTGTYGFACGRVAEEDNDLLDTAVREFKEETGLLVKKENLSSYPGNYYEAKIPRKDGTIKTFSMTVYLGGEYEGELCSTDETTPEWIPLSLLHTIQLLPNIESAINAGLDFLNER